MQGRDLRGRLWDWKSRHLWHWCASKHPESSIFPKSLTRFSEQVAVGYVIETALGFCLAALFLLQARLAKNKQSEQATTVKGGVGHGSSDIDRASLVLKSGIKTFFDSAAYFCIALQIATIAIVAQKDFGLSTSDFGAIEAQIAHAVSVVSLLPLLAPVILLENSTVDSEGRDPRSNPRLFLLNLAVSLSFYPFVSRSFHSFGPSPISDGESGEVPRAKWNGIENLCFNDGLDGLRSNRLFSALDGIELASSLVVYLTTLWQQCGLLSIHFYHSRLQSEDGVLRRRHSPSVGYRILEVRERMKEWIGGNAVCGAILLFIPLGLACPLLWIVFMLRHLQEDLTNNAIADGSYSGNDWGFGQVVSIVLFLPVAINMFYRGRFGRT